jgi:hypothetical protein
MILALLIETLLFFYTYFIKLKFLLAEGTDLFLHQPGLEALVMEPMFTRRQLIHDLPNFKVAVTHRTFFLLPTMLFLHLNLL